jgi:hypothetical protein
VGIAVWLVRTNERWLTAFWRHISQPFAEATLTKLRRTSAKLNGVICTEGRKAKLHCPIMFIAERQNVRAHWSSLASTWRHLLFRLAGLTMLAKWIMGCHCRPLPKVPRNSPAPSTAARLNATDRRSVAPSGRIPAIPSCDSYL